MDQRSFVWEHNLHSSFTICLYLLPCWGLVRLPLQDLLLHEEAVDGLLLPHELDDQAVQVDEESAAEAAGDAVEKGGGFSGSGILLPTPTDPNQGPESRWRRNGSRQRGEEPLPLTRCIINPKKTSLNKG